MSTNRKKPQRAGLRVAMSNLFNEEESKKHKLERFQRSVVERHVEAAHRPAKELDERHFSYVDETDDNDSKYIAEHKRFMKDNPGLRPEGQKYLARLISMHETRMAERAHFQSQTTKDKD
jgi:hypothetical protein